MVIDGLVEDLSRGGLFLCTEKTIRPGTSAEIELDLPGEETLHLVVEVVRVERRDDRAGMGLRFVDERDAGRPLANFIMRQHQSFR